MRLSLAAFAFWSFDTINVELLLLLPRNQGIRKRYQECYRAYCTARWVMHDEHGDVPFIPPSDEERARLAELSIPVGAIEAMLIMGPYQKDLADYRACIAAKDWSAVREIECAVANAVMRHNPGVAC